MSDRFPDPDLPQDPGIPGFDVVSDAGDEPPPTEHDPAVEDEAHPESDDEGQLAAADD